MEMKSKVLASIATCIVIVISGICFYFSSRSPSKSNSEISKSLSIQKPSALNSLQSKPILANQSVVKIPSKKNKNENVVTRLSDPNIPLTERKAEIDAIAQQGDTAAGRTLIEIAQSGTYLNWYAIQAMSRFTGETAELSNYLSKNLNAPEARFASYSIQSYTKLFREKSTPELIQALAQNRERPDGYSYNIQGVIVESLGDLAPREASVQFMNELARSNELGWSLEYGSKLVYALERSRTPQAFVAVQEYADRLKAKSPADPLTKKYFETKIAEAREIANRLKPTNYNAAKL
jgi:hypothetical protein